MKMEMKQFRIGELAEKLNVERFVVRFWEKEFSIKSTRSSGGQRFYTEEDYETFKKIKQLLYEEKFTIQGAKKQLLSDANGAHKTSFEQSAPTRQSGAKKTDWVQEELVEQVVTLKKHLQKLRELL